MPHIARARVQRSSSSGFRVQWAGGSRLCACVRLLPGLLCRRVNYFIPFDAVASLKLLRPDLLNCSEWWQKPPPVSQLCRSDALPL